MTRVDMLKMTGLLLCATLTAARGAEAQQAPATFHSGTRLVEVEVVVRNKNGPVAGLTKDDFTVLDQGRPQVVSLFQARSAAASKSAPAALPPGAVSNRIDSHGEPLNGATVVLLDQLNTIFDLKAYERRSMTKLLRSLTATDHIALYSLGKNLHVLQDFTDDPQKLVDALAKIDPGLDLIPPDLASIGQGMPDPGSIHTGDATADRMTQDAIGNLAGLEAAVAADIREDITERALQRIIQHLAGVAGRKNLVWLQERPAVPPRIMGMLQQANIALYPVMIRGLGDSGVFSASFGTLSMGPARCPECERRHAVESLGAATGGAGFTDALDLTTAVRTAEDDASYSYTLGYYPPQEVLDGRYHRITVRLANKSLAVRYRPGYLATKTEPPTPALDEAALLEDPLDSTGIGITAQLASDPEHPGKRQLHINVDLHDIHLETANGQVSGAFQISISNPFKHWFRSVRIPLNFPAQSLAQGLESGFTLIETGIDPQPGEFHIVVRDPGTGAAGSLRVPSPKP